MKARLRIALALDLQWPQKRHTATFAGVQRYAGEHGWETVIDDYAANELAAWRKPQVPYDGVLGRVSAALAEQCRRWDLPVVNTWYSSPVWKQLPGVFPDAEATGRLRAEHLLGRGLCRFAVVGREDRAAKAETAAFEAAVREAGFPCIGIKLPLRPTQTYAVWKRSEQAIEALMRRMRPPVGLFVSIDDIGRLAAQMCIRRGWRVPQDVAIIAGWNEEAICEHPRPSLTSVELGCDRVGYEAAKLLDQLMSQAPPRRRRSARRIPQHIFIAPQGLVVRESTDFFAVDGDDLVSAAITFIAANCHRRIGQDDVSRAVNAETRTLQNRFRKVLDRPIVAVIRQLRIERAKRELVQGTRSMAEIAQSVGFGLPARMNDVFRREVGVTPSEYRRRLHGQPLRQGAKSPDSIGRAGAVGVG